MRPLRVKRLPATIQPVHSTNRSGTECGWEQIWQYWVYLECSSCYLKYKLIAITLKENFRLLLKNYMIADAYLRKGGQRHCREGRAGFLPFLLLIQVAESANNEEVGLRELCSYLISFLTLRKLITSSASYFYYLLSVKWFQKQFPPWRKGPPEGRQGQRAPPAGRRRGAGKGVFPWLRERLCCGAGRGGVHRGEPVASEETSSRETKKRKKKP